MIREIYVYIKSTKQNGGYTVGFSPKLKVVVMCSSTTQPFITDPVDTYKNKQYVLPNQGSLSNFMCEYFTLGNPFCPISAI